MAIRPASTFGVGLRIGTTAGEGGDAEVLSVPCWGACSLVVLLSGGGGIRTHVTVSRKHAFQACAFSHSAPPPYPPCTVSRRMGASGTTIRAQTGTAPDDAARIELVRWGGTIVAMIGLTRHCHIDRSKTGGTQFSP